MIRPDAVERFGLLSEAIQVKGAIALAGVTHTELHLDGVRLDALKAELKRQVDDQLAVLEAEPGCADLVNRDRHGRVVLTAKTRSPGLKQNRLRELLRQAAADVAGETGRPVPVPQTDKGQVSLKADDWEDLAPHHPLVRAWIELGKTTKSLQYFGNLAGQVVHPKYNPLVRTGRTSCSAPNVQNLPRKGGFREAFVPSPGHLFLVVDYSFIELRTLAAVCEARFGTSKLADVIRAGVDPHTHTAAVFEGMDPEAFIALKSGGKAERDRFGTLRQRAKVLIFGIPGGLGAASLVAYAKSAYDVTLSLVEAGEFRRRLIEEVYPELGLYLADDAMDVLAGNLGSTPRDCWERLDWKGDRSGGVVGGVRNVVKGKTHNAKRKPYAPLYLRGVWDGLIALNRNDGLAPLLSRRQGGEELSRRLFFSGVTTLTGRVRGRVSFTQARNTPFQGLAADGAKLALWDLTRAGYRVVAFIHDEILIELPETGVDHAAEAGCIEAIMNGAMGRVTGDVPVACEFALCRRWSKKASAVFEDGRLVPYDVEPD